MQSFNPSIRKNVKEIVTVDRNLRPNGPIEGWIVYDHNASPLEFFFNKHLGMQYLAAVCGTQIVRWESDKLKDM